MIHLGIRVFSLENQQRIRESNHFSPSYVAHLQFGGFVFARELSSRGYTITLIICRLNVLSFAFLLFVLYFVRDSFNEYLLKYDNQDIRLVGEECCTAKKNTPYICSDAFNELGVYC